MGRKKKPTILTYTQAQMLCDRIEKVADVLDEAGTYIITSSSMPPEMEELYCKMEELNDLAYSFISDIQQKARLALIKNKMDSNIKIQL